MRVAARNSSVPCMVDWSVSFLSTPPPFSLQSTAMSAFHLATHASLLVLSHLPWNWSPLPPLCHLPDVQRAFGVARSLDQGERSDLEIALAASQWEQRPHQCKFNLGSSGVSTLNETMHYQILVWNVSLMCPAHSFDAISDPVCGEMRKRDKRSMDREKSTFLHALLIWHVQLLLRHLKLFLV